MTYSALDAAGGSFRPNPASPLALLQANFNYQPTPVRNIGSAAGDILWVKDETERLGLTAFKALGGMYAVARLIARQWYATYDQHLQPAEYRSAEVQAFASRLTFVCASAGNHGLAVARGAACFGAAARIHLADTVPDAFVQRLTRLGATVVRSGADYEASVALAIEDAERSGDMLLADGSWPGYLEPPALVMEGYSVMAEELRSHFSQLGQWPNQVFLQAGVGGLAAAITYMIRENWSVQPEIIIVEPDAAPCLQQSHTAGQAVSVAGPVSAMGRLDCKQPSLLAFDVLRRAADRFITVSDADALEAAEALSRSRLPTTASGAAGYAGWQNTPWQGSGDRRALVIVTEGPV